MDENTGTIDWRRPAYWAAVALLLAGCESLGTTTKYSNPVVPPPPRVRLTSKDADDPSSDARTSVEGTAKTAGRPKSGKATISSASATNPTEDTAAAGSNGTRGTRSTARKSAAPGKTDERPAEEDTSELVTQATDSRPADGWQGNARRRQTARPKGGSGKEVVPASGDEDPSTLKLGVETEGSGQVIEKGKVAATVNGVPIFLSEVLFGYGPGLEQAKKNLPPEEFRRQKRDLVAKQLEPHIERELLLQALRGKLKEENLTGLRKHIDAEFDTQMVAMMKKLGVGTQGELEMQLKKQGQSIDFLKTKFRNQQLAQQYLSSQAIPRTGFDLPDLHAYYQENQEKYAIPGRVKWQQIHLVNGKHGGKSGTKKFAAEVVKRLEAGEDFTTVAKEVSDGPTKHTGGFWDWTVESSLKSKELDEALFSMPIGESFALIESPEAIDIVVVLARNDAGVKSFESVQDDIRVELKQAEFKRAVEGVFAELRAKATIEKFTDTL